jgi:DNA-binding response OmpR family regulator
MHPGSTKTVLVIEDDRNTANLIVVYLKREGFRTLTSADGEAGLEQALGQRPDLVILDLMLPKLDGWEVCRRLRQRSEVPVIMLTARAEEVDRVAGLTLGADDYVVKPFSPRELMARVRAVLRRAPIPDPGRKARLSHADVVLDLDKRQLRVAGRPVALTPHEYAILKALMSAPGRIFTRDELIRHIYPRAEAVVIDRVIDVHIGKLRQKIEPDPSTPERILTVRGVGYRFADKQSPDEEQPQ